MSAEISRLDRDAKLCISMMYSNKYYEFYKSEMFRDGLTRELFIREPSNVQLCVLKKLTDIEGMDHFSLINLDFTISNWY